MRQPDVQVDGDAMARRTVAIADLPSLFESLLERRITPTRRGSEGLCRKVQEGLADVKDTATKLLRENVMGEADEASKASISSADRLGQKIIDLVGNLEAPKEVTYNALVGYVKALRMFQSQVVNAASVWIPRLPIGLKGVIRELEARMKLLGFSVNSLENHLSGKHRHVDKLEKMIEDSKSLVSLDRELRDLDRTVGSHEKEKEKLDEDKRKIDQAIKELDEHEVSKQIIEQKKQLHNICNQISQLFQPLKKPIEKLLKTADSKNGLLTSNVRDTLQRYLNDPVDAVENEEGDFNDLRSALDTLRNMLASGSVELKESRVRNALRSISEIGSGSTLETLHKAYRQLVLQHRRSSSSGEARDIDKKRRELESRNQQVTGERSRIGSDLESLRSRRNELNLRISCLKADLEERSRLIAGEEVDILD